MEHLWDLDQFQKFMQARKLGGIPGQEIGIIFLVRRPIRFT